jgi:putative ABC transport system substrate-binding protein
MDRRTFLVALVVAAGCGPDEAPRKAVDRKPATAIDVDAPHPEQRPADPPPARIPRIAFLSFGTRSNPSASALSSVATLFRGRLTELGYVEGQTVLIDENYADGDAQRLAQLAHEIVARKPDVIVSIAAAATAAARQATSTIPIVMTHAGNPVGSGLVASLSHPGGNVTGTTSMVPELGVKQVDLLRQLIPGLATLGVLANPTNAGAPPLIANVKEAARRFNIRVVVAEVTRHEDFDHALGVLRDAYPDAMLVMIEPVIFVNRARVLDFAARSRLPASYDVGREIVREGGLVSYGPLLTAHYAIAAEYVDKILKGARPGDLPVQQPTQFALVINMNTARELGVTVPQSLLLRADEVIQ